MTDVLVTGGCGYVGSHVSLALIDKGYSVVIVDNFSNSYRNVSNILVRLAGKALTVVEADIRDQMAMSEVLSSNDIQQVIHCAGLKSVEDSFRRREEYFENNIIGTEVLLDAMQLNGIRKIIFSSSATVYGCPEYLPIDESHRLSPANPYGETKMAVEKMLAARVELGLSAVILRYFNPLGAHSSGLLGDNPKGKPANLGAVVIDSLCQSLEPVKIFGSDYDTNDGTGSRDYIHITDLAAGHLAAVDYLKRNDGVSIFNLGTGQPHSVKEVISTFEKVSGQNISVEYAARREGDQAAVFAEPALAQKNLRWKAQLGLEEMCASAWYFGKLTQGKKFGPK